MNYLLISLTLLISGVSFSQQLTDTIHVYFDLNSAEVSTASENEVWELMRSNNIPSAVNAHADTLGSVAYNDQLSKQRLDAVLEILERNENLEFAEGFKTNAVGEREAMLSNRYRAEDFRRVDVVYEVYVEEEVIIELPPMSKAVKMLTDSLADFLSDTTQSEALIQLNVLFYNSSVQYLPESETELETIFQFLKNNPNVNAHIRGHICCRSYTTWDDISHGRAKTVFVYLRRRGIENPQERMTFQGYGTSMPFRSPEISEEDEKLNRRVDIIFTKAK
ncbi:MAG: OmpA family protein [Crocinitomicaceae bacterium]|nr:OmpA family protein [Crocinitomicaceae bacterium]